MRIMDIGQKGFIELQDGRILKVVHADEEKAICMKPGEIKKHCFYVRSITLKPEIVAGMEEFALRVLKGGENANMQETAVLPKILEILSSIKHTG